ncbi:MAG: hypothetical protein ABIR98_02445 [Usitatibacter sp.]
MNSLSTQCDAKSGIFQGVARIICALALGVATASCVGLQPRTPEEAVKARAQARWDALLKGDIKAAYGFLSPGSRVVMTQEAYGASLRSGFWKSAAVEKAACDAPDACEAQLTIEYEFQGKRTKTPLRETWIREGTNWWYVQK